MYLLLAGLVLLLAFIWFFSIEYWRGKVDTPSGLSFVLGWVNPIGLFVFVLMAWLLLRP
jgi:hypothetical protein